MAILKPKYLTGLLAGCLALLFSFSAPRTGGGASGKGAILQISGAGAFMRKLKKGIKRLANKARKSVRRFVSKVRQGVRRIAQKIKNIGQAVSKFFSKRPFRKVRRLISDLAHISKAGYLEAEMNAMVPGGYRIIKKASNGKTGFQALAVEGPSQVVIAFAGTKFDDPRDLLADLGISKAIIKEVVKGLLTRFKMYLLNGLLRFGKLVAGTWKRLNSAWQLISRPFKKALSRMQGYRIRNTGNQAIADQVREAKAFTAQVLASLTGASKGKKVLITGHSLGGFLAQVVGAWKKFETHTFNAPGAAGYEGAPRFGKVTNHVRSFDIVGRFGRHVGQVVKYPDTPMMWSRIKERFLNRNHSIVAFINELKANIKK